MSLTATQTTYFHCIVNTLANECLLSSSLFEIHTLEDALLPHISIDLLQGRKVSFANALVMRHGMLDAL
jgi:hypothetical protein